MSISTIVKSSLVVAVLASLAMTMPVSANSGSTNECAVKMIGSKNSVGASDSRWILNDDGTVTGSIKVTGDYECEQTVTLAAWEAPNADKGMPYDQQKLVDHVTKTFSVGTHKISIKLPTCFYQLDLVKGSKATGVDNSPVYSTDVMLGSLHGGTKSCIPEIPKTPETPKELPKTGAGSNVVMIALSATVLGTTLKSFRLRRTA